MVDARDTHTATLLNDGTVLIAGGYDDSGPVASAEIYNPATGMFTSTTGNLTTPRYSHSATLLNSGKVLIAGGLNATPGQVTLASAETYDPATGLFTATGSLTLERWQHTATLLTNGQVLIASGQCNCVYPGSDADVYDPGSGTFSSAGNMIWARFDDTATLLLNGNVLFAGGISSLGSGTGSFVNATAEIYQPASLTPPGLVSIAVSPANPTIAAGTAQRFVATGTFSSGPAQTLSSVIWSSSNTAVAGITNDMTNSGHAQGLAIGVATITATAGSISGSTLLTVGP
jgi:hypothetical protein